MNIVLETSDCIIVDKPAHWLSVPGRDINDGRPVLGRELEKTLDVKIYPIHRLDAEVSGLIVYAKNPDFHREANVLFENKLVTKTYQAFSEKGSFMKGEKVVWKSLLLRGKKRAYEADFGKPSLTEGYVFDETKSSIEWRLNPRTGRGNIPDRAVGPAAAAKREHALFENPVPLCRPSLDHDRTSEAWWMAVHTAAKLRTIKFKPHHACAHVQISFTTMAGKPAGAVSGTPCIRSASIEICARQSIGSSGVHS